MKVLFICLGNVARSQMAEAFFNHLTHSTDATSAGCLEFTPTKYGHPIQEVVSVMKEEGIDVSNQLVKVVTPSMILDSDKIIVFCKKEECPDIVLNAPQTSFTPIEDPFDSSLDTFRNIRDQIKLKILNLIAREEGSVTIIRMNTHNDLLTRGVENIIPSAKKLNTLLDSGKKLNIYLGIDPTATNIHLGHAVPLRKLNQLATLGHNVKFLIGDFTALIGDTSDKDAERPVLTTEQIQANFETYKKQAEKVLDFSKIEVVYNSSWLKELKFEDIVKLAQHFSAGDFTSRELIKKRLTDGKHVGLHELLYPVMQGYDSYHMDTDIQLGGTDQTFNMQAGRVLQKDLRDKESFIIANGFLSGTDGRKMSKSWGNAIWLNDSPNNMYGKVMSLKDDLIINYFTLATNLELEKIEVIKKALDSGENPMTYKKQLALQIVTELHSAESAQEAQEFFESTVQNKEMPTDVPTISVKSNATVIEVLKSAELGVSNSDIKRTLEQGGVEVDGEKVTDPMSIVVGNTLKFGKRTFRKISYVAN